MHALTLATAYVLGTIAVARATRLLVHDDWPPIRNLRLRFIEWNDTRDFQNAQTGKRPGWAHGWGNLLQCPFCFAPYLTATVLAVAIWGGVWQPGWSLAGVWWVAAVWGSSAYLAAIIVLRDEPEE